ncbi:MAG: cupin domain-containing protein [Paracoccaceae bacterium]
MAQAKDTLLLENDRVRVTEWRFQQGDETGWHTHGMDYVAVPMGDGALRLEQPGGGETRAELTSGKPYFRAAGVEHNVINDSGREFAFIEIELK